MNQLVPGLALLTAGVFGLGWVAAPNAAQPPEPKVRVKVVTVDKWRVEKKTVTVTTPAPEVVACKNLPADYRTEYDLLAKMSAAFGPAARAASDATAASQGVRDAKLLTDAQSRLRQVTLDLVTATQNYKDAQNKSQLDLTECNKAERK